MSKRKYGEELVTIPGSTSSEGWVGSTFCCDYDSVVSHKMRMSHMNVPLATTGFEFFMR